MWLTRVLLFASKTLPFQTKWLMKVANSGARAVPESTMAVPSASPLGMGPGGLATKSFSISGWGIFKSLETSYAIACPPAGESRCRRISPRFLERLQELDQSPLVVVAEPGLFLEPVGAEVVAAVHLEVGALGELEKRIDQVCEHLARLVVAGVLGQRLEVAPHLDQEVHELLLVAELLDRVAALGLQIQVGEQVDRRALGDRTDLHAAIAEQPRQGAVGLEKPGEPALHGPDGFLDDLGQVAERDVHRARLRRPVDATRDLVAEQQIALSLLGPE